jgi:hypothetical protein
MLVDFTGFAGDCLITGHLDLRAERLTDQLNAETELQLKDVVLEGLLDGRQVATPTFTIARSDLCAVKAGPPRGSRRLRAATEIHRLQAQIGPYTVLGRLHAPPGSEALLTIHQREIMVPLTDATIAYLIGGILEVRDAPTVIINRELASWLRAADADPVVPPTQAPPLETSQV